MERGRGFPNRGGRTFKMKLEVLAATVNHSREEDSEEVEEEVEIEK